MRQALKARLERLETAAAVPPSPIDDAVAQANVRRRLDAMFARIKVEQDEQKHPDPRTRLQAWLRTKAKQEAIIACGGKSEKPPHPTTINPGGLDAILLKSAHVSLPSIRWQILEAQLAILAQLGYANREIESLRQEHGRFNGIPWQWRGPELPTDAARLIEQADLE